MKSHFFSQAELGILGDASKWRLISSGFPVEARPAVCPEHDNWAQKHVHSHPHREILIVLDGTGYQQHCGKTYPLHPGTIMFFDAMEQHEMNYPADHPRARHMWCDLRVHECRLRILRVAVRHAKRHFRVEVRRRYPLPELGFASHRALFPKTDPLVPTEWTRHQCVAALDLLITHLVEESYQPQAPSDKKKHVKHVIESTIQQIHEQNGRNCSLKTLAHSAGYSMYHFSRMFMEHAGMSLHDCINDARTRALHEMLGEGVPLKTVAAELGFANASSLCRWRRKHDL